MLTFERRNGAHGDRIRVHIDNLVIAGWTGRDANAIQHHVEELAAIGVPPPSATPLFYRVSNTLVTQTDRLQVLGPDTSGEAEPVVVALADGLWLGVGSDQTDRKAESMSVALSVVQQVPSPATADSSAAVLPSRSGRASALTV